MTSTSDQHLDDLRDLCVQYFKAGDVQLTRVLDKLIDKHLELRRLERELNQESDYVPCFGC